MLYQITNNRENIIFEGPPENVVKAVKIYNRFGMHRRIANRLLEIASGDMIMVQSS